MQIVLDLDPREAYALRKFVARASSHEVADIISSGVTADLQLVDAARYKLSAAIWSALGAPCVECGGPESDHQANYYCPEYRDPW